MPEVVCPQCGGECDPNERGYEPLQDEANQSLRQQLEKRQRELDEYDCGEEHRELEHAHEAATKRYQLAEQQLEQLLDALSAWRKTIEGSGAEETAQHHLYAVIDEIRAALAELEKG